LQYYKPKKINVAYENNDKRMESVYSKRIRAGKRRTYFFDVRATRSNDYYLTITESRKKFNEDGYDRHKIFLYKEDFNKFIKALTEAVDYVKTDLMPDFDFDAFNHDQVLENGEVAHHENHESPVENVSADADIDEIKSEVPVVVSSSSVEPATPSSDHLEEVDKW
jgi:Protein of unknown function (DUF3276)